MSDFIVKNLVGGHQVGNPKLIVTTGREHNFDRWAKLAAESLISINENNLEADMVRLQAAMRMMPHFENAIEEEKLSMMINEDHCSKTRRSSLFRYQKFTTS